LRLILLCAISASSCCSISSIRWSIFFWFFNFECGPCDIYCVVFC
jgi:hypothetical protein